MRFLVGCIALLFATGAEAKHSNRHHHRHHHSYLRKGVMPIGYQKPVRIDTWPRSAQSLAGAAPHPAGCPRTQFCGCGVSVRVYGHSVRSLWLAANWRRFPRAIPQPGTVAVFGWHHVAYIERMLTALIALVYDPNSGHHQTRIHPRSIAGATIVRPL